MSNAKYLQVTIHDNDFWCSLSHVGYLLQQIFEYEGKYPTEDDFPALKECIKHIWYGTYNIANILRKREMYLEPETFNPQLKFVNYEDIPDSDNSESIFIPMFIGEVLWR